jgi:hypothetical protein
MPKSTKGSRQAASSSPKPSHKKSASLKPSTLVMASASTTTIPRPPPSTSSSNRTSPASPSFPAIGTTQVPREESVEEEGEYDAPQAPIFGSVPGGFRNNFLRSVRDRSGTIREESEESSVRSPNEDKNRKTPSSPAPREGFFGGSRHKGLGEGKGGPRKPNGGTSTSEGRSPTPEDPESIDGSTWKEKRRGSMIKNLGQKAKGVLPMKRTVPKQARREDEYGALAVKSASSDSSFQSSQSGDGQTRYNETSSDSGEDYEERGDDETLKGRARMINSHTVSASTHDLQLPLQSPSDRSPPKSEKTNGKYATRPKSVPTRSSSSDAVHQNNGEGYSGVVKRSNKIMQMSAEDLKPLKPETPLNSPSLMAEANTKGPIPTALKPPINGTTTPSTNGMDGRNHSKSASKDLPAVASRAIRPSPSSASLDMTNASRNRSTSQLPSQDRPNAPRSTSAIKLSSTSLSPRPTPSKLIQSSRIPHQEATEEPPLPDPDQAPTVESAPPNGMYWFKAPCFGFEPTAVRAHTSTLIGSNIFVFGGCDSKSCFNDLFVFDADCMAWTHPECSGDIPPPLRAMTATAVGKKLVIFGGGDGPSYYNDIYILDTINFRYTKPEITNPHIPSKRRAHTACLYKNGIYIFGGGDGVRALNDVWRLDVSDLSKMYWKLISPPSTGSKFANNSSSIDSRLAAQRPTARGYHTSNMVGSKLIIFGGSDGVECFRDVWIFDVETLIWRCVDIKTSFPRLSHTATIVGSYLFVIGGHDGVEYSSDVLLLNLVTMHWDRRRVFGAVPSGRGYHGTVLHDSRLFIFGGFDG